MLSNAWREPGFCVPNPATYPYQWLWDSCFHSIIWAELGDDRCVTELANTLAHQDGDGFVPHMTYWGVPDAHAELLLLLDVVPRRLRSRCERGTRVPRLEQRPLD